MRRTVITGLGAVTPVGHNVEDSWRNILEGKSGIDIIDHFDTSAFSSRIGGSIRASGSGSSPRCAMRWRSPISAASFIAT